MFFPCLMLPRFFYLLLSPHTAPPSLPLPKFSIQRLEDVAATSYNDASEKLIPGIMLEVGLASGTQLKLKGRGNDLPPLWPVVNEQLTALSTQ